MYLFMLVSFVRYFFLAFSLSLSMYLCMGFFPHCCLLSSFRSFFISLLSYFVLSFIMNVCYVWFLYLALVLFIVKFVFLSLCISVWLQFVI